MIIRPDYIKRTASFIDAPLVKIFSGVRRCGKSTILEMLQNELKTRGIPEKNLIARNYSHAQYEDFTAKDMFLDLKSSLNKKSKCYLFLDELQEIDGWERVVNTLLENENTDIYVTGSNSKLMSSEISTYLTGRYVSIPVYTLSFREFLLFQGNTDSDPHAAFARYLQYGGFPVIGAGNFNTHSAYQIVDDIYAAVITRDIAKRHQIRNQELFDRVVRFIIENLGKTFSANAIINFLKNEKRSLSVETVYNYLKWLSEAFIIYPCKRYDLQGKSVLKTQEKYYLSDISLKYSQMGFDTKMIASVMENIVFLEMKRRGYDVYIGKNDMKEIDFVGIMRDEKIYIQVCRQLPENSSRETDNLMEIRDNYHKYVVTLDEFAAGNDNGIKIMHIADFLLKEEW